MAISQVDPTKTIDSDRWAVSLLVTTTFSLGHTLIAVEGLLQGVRKSVVAHYVPLRLPGMATATKSELLKGMTNGGVPIQGQVKIKTGARTASVKDLVGSPFSSKTWMVSRDSAFRVLDRINIDSLRGHSAAALQTYNFRMIGKFTEPTDDLVGGINCANWAQMMLREAGVTDQGGLLIDFPRTQTLNGSRSEWMLGLFVGLGATAAATFLASLR